MYGILLTSGLLVLRFEINPLSPSPSLTEQNSLHTGCPIRPSLVRRIRSKIIEDMTEAWCIAKVRRLVGQIEPPVKPDYQEEFELAEYFETGTFKHEDDDSERRFITVGPYGVIRSKCRQSEEAPCQPCQENPRHSESTSTISY